MITLALDTCFGACSVAAGEVRDGAFSVAAQGFERRQTGHAESLMPMVRRVMEQIPGGFGAVRRIAVTTGPGSFTGMRIGVAAARSLALATSAEIVTATSLEVMADAARATLGADASNHPLLIAVDARKDEVYVQLFAKSGEALSDPQVLPPNAAAKLVSAGAAYIAGSGAEIVRQCAPNLAVTAILPDLVPDAVALARVTAPRSAAKDPAKPLYLRPPDAKPQAGFALTRTS